MKSTLMGAVAHAKARFDRAFSACPGAWYGNPPGAFGNAGSVTVSADRVVSAINHLRRCGYNLTGSKASRDPGGVLLWVHDRRLPKPEPAEFQTYIDAAGSDLDLPGDAAKPVGHPLARSRGVG